MWRTAWIRIWMESCVVNREFYKQSWDGTGTSLSESRFLKVAIIPGGGDTPLYKLHSYVPPQRVWFLGLFGLKTGMDFRGHCMRSENGFGKWHVLV